MEIVAALVTFRIRNGVKELLFRRDRDSYYWSFPGGTQRPGESVGQSLSRNLASQGIDAGTVRRLGTISTHARDGKLQITHVFAGATSSIASPDAEWMDKTRARLQSGFMTASMVDVLLPHLEAERHW